MADRGNIPNSPACGQWETLLADALDGLLRPEDEATFTSHMAGCAACTALFEEARQGREWLEFLSPEPEVPEGLLDKILAQTGPGHTCGVQTGTRQATWFRCAIPAWQRPGLMGRIRRFAEPRLLMTAAMAFFSIALTLNMTGVRLSRTSGLSNLKPTAVRSFMERRFTMASTPIIRYYDHLRLVYEVESRMRSCGATDQLRNSNRTRLSRSAPGSQNKTLIGKTAGPASIRRSSPEPGAAGTPALRTGLSGNFRFHDQQTAQATETCHLANSSHRT